MAQPQGNSTGAITPGPRGNGALALLSILALFLGFFAAVSPVAIEQFRYGGSGTLPCVMGQAIPPGFDADVDPVSGTYSLFPARVNCQWRMPDGSELRTSRTISTASTVLTITCGGLGIAGLTVAETRRARHKRAIR
jgi:hypothetical protein|nr:hypothetical protein [Sphaerisporangium cinnabarinum]